MKALIYKQTLCFTMKLLFVDKLWNRVLSNCCTTCSTLYTRVATLWVQKTSLSDYKLSWVFLKPKKQCLDRRGNLLSPDNQEQLAARLKILGNNYNQHLEPITIKFLNKINYKITKYWKLDQLKLIQNLEENYPEFFKNLKKKFKLAWVGLNVWHSWYTYEDSLMLVFSDN